MPKKKAPATSTLREVTEPTYGESAKAPTRADIRRQSADENGALVAVEAFTALNELIYNTDLSDVHPLNSAEVDLLAAELVAVRTAKDIVEGREAALKKYATEVIDLKINMQGDDPTATSGYLVSPENGIKLSKEVSGGKLTVDIDLLEKVLDADQFRSVINVVETQVTTTRPDGSKSVDASVSRVLNEEALEKELKLGNIGMEQVVQATTPGKVRSAFYVRSL
jgi:hypothetical protein